MLGNLIHWLIETVSTLGYPGIVVLMAIESSLLPLPSELVMPPAGYLAAQGRMDPFLAVAAGTLGSVLGALVNYFLAIWIGEPVLRRFGKYVLISDRSLTRTQAYFARHGEISTFVGRLLPVIRHLISIPAGLARMNLGKFALFTAIGAGIWCSVLTYIGWFVGKHEAQLKEISYQAMANDVLLKYILPALVVLIVGYVIWHRRRRAGQA
ncbi:MAG TPA: DedA family protein [Gemmatimonadales bacterium]|nr:DedA family protein [Gemmatimonadales bacterium]